MRWNLHGSHHNKPPASVKSPKMKRKYFPILSMSSLSSSLRFDRDQVVYEMANIKPLFSSQKNIAGWSRTDAVLGAMTTNRKCDAPNLQISPLNRNNGSFSIHCLRALLCGHCFGRRSHSIRHWMFRMKRRNYNFLFETIFWNNFLKRFLFETFQSINQWRGWDNARMRA